MLEQEYKCIINREMYLKLVDHFKWDDIKEQTNHYYCDKEGVLSQQKIMVRIREKDGIYKIQVKKHHGTNTVSHIADELEFEADSVAEYIEAQKAYEITGIKTENLYRIGALSTKRHSLKWNDTAEICLDKSTYFDITDYEIEVEYSEEEPVKLLEDLQKLGISFNEKGPGKYSRFVSRFKEILEENK